MKLEMEGVVLLYPLLQGSLDIRVPEALALALGEGLAVRDLNSVGTGNIRSALAALSILTEIAVVERGHASPLIAQKAI